MTFTLDNAVVYDIETICNCFTLSMEQLHSDVVSTWEISTYRDDRAALFEWFDYLTRAGIPMIGFNSLHFDYPVIHFLNQNRRASVADIYSKAQQIIKSQDRFGHTIWERDRFAPQVDLFKIHHFDNKAKTTSLKGLEINMRSKTVRDMPVPHDQPISADDIERYLIPYNLHDVSETKKFAHYSMKALKFRLGLIPQFGLEALNFNDTKIGAKILENRLGEDVCYDRSSGRRAPRQTPRSRIALRDIIFPYISFQHPELQRVHAWMLEQTLTPEDLEDPDATIKTKGVFTKLRAMVGGVEFQFGTGGIHGSVPPQRVEAGGEWEVHDIDVEGLYPRIAVVNRLAPAHLGQAFVVEYEQLPLERKKHAKGTVENASLKLAGNGTYGNSNNKFSVFYDPQFTMTITINGQLMLCMLAEWLLAVPSLQIIQINTDGITYRIKSADVPQAREIEERWQAFTWLKLEYAQYNRMFIRDVNNYVAEPLTKPGSNEPPKLKQKGAYWHPDPLNYADSISEASPPCWYKDLSAIVVTRAAVAAMIHGVPVEQFIRCHSDPFDFMLRARATGQSELLLGGRKVQKTLRYYIAREGAPLIKVMPANGPEGAFKRKNGVTEAQYLAVMNANGWQWHADVCTGNKSVYGPRESNEQAGWNVADCSDAAWFDWKNINYDWYIQEAKKLVI